MDEAIYAIIKIEIDESIECLLLTTNLLDLNVSLDLFFKSLRRAKILTHTKRPR